jgi:hypothetical protein
VSRKGQLWHLVLELFHLQVTDKQVQDFVASLKGRLSYETKKATKLGFSNVHEYARNKLANEAEVGEQKLLETPAIKRVTNKVSKKKAVKVSTCGCCS